VCALGDRVKEHGALAILCALALFFWHPFRADSEGPEPYIRGIRIVLLGARVRLLRVGSYLDWKSRGAIL